MIAAQSEGGEISYVVYSPIGKKFDYSAEHMTNKMTAMLCQIKSIIFNLIWIYKQIHYLYFNLFYIFLDSVHCLKDKGWYYKTSCFFPLYGTYTWYEAQNECIKAGGNLAVFDDLDVNDVNQTWAQSLGDKKYWIGLNRVQITWNKTSKYFIK